MTGREYLLLRFMCQGPVCVQVVVKDGRVLVGQLSCLDKQGNLILANTVQVLTGDTAGESWRRSVMLRSALPSKLLVQSAGVELRHIRPSAWGAGGGQGLSRHPEERLIGLVLVPPQQRVSCEAEVPGQSLALACYCMTAWHRVHLSASRAGSCCLYPVS